MKDYSTGKICCALAALKEFEQAYEDKNGVVRLVMLQIYSIMLR